MVVAGDASMSPDRGRPAVAVTTAEAEEGDRAASTLDSKP